MKRIAVVFLATLLLAQGIGYAQIISDVPKTDPAFSAITKSVKDGYLSTFSSDTFQPQQAVSRKELAIIIDKLSSDLSDRSSSLTKGDTQELKSLLKSFKGYMSDTDSVRTASDSRLTLVEDEQKVLNHDLSKINDSLKLEIETLKQQNQNEHVYLWGGVIGAVILGILVK